MTDTLEREIRMDELFHQIRSIETWISESRRQLKGLVQERAALKAGIEVENDDRPKWIGVTEHAVCRYVERVMGFNRHSLETKVFPPAYASHVMNSHGSQEIQIGNTHSVIIADRRVITVLTSEREY